MRRAAVSVPANIVEGYSRKNKKEKLQFYYVAKGSLTELEYYIDLSYRLEFLNNQEYKLLKEKRDEVGKLLNGFINNHSK